MEGRLDLLQQSLRLLALNADAQCEYLNQAGLSGVVDELALEYDAVAAAADNMVSMGEIGDNTRKCVKSLDTYLKKMSGQVNAHLWTPQALIAAPEWETVRRLAKNCLEMLPCTKDKSVHRDE